MIDSIGYYESPCLNPYRNLAVEETLLDGIGDREVIMYLWRNEHTVVVGRNQNIWNECNVGRLKESGGFPARRLSGGGAVYHDAQNLNFTFLATKGNYSVARQTEVIRQAVKRLGLNAVRNGRNDICIDGRKFSGNAFCEKGDRCFHHGTIMIHTDVEEMNRFLNVPAEKLLSKGVASVRSRVVNLSELNGAITVETMKRALFESFCAEYGLVPRIIADSDLDTTLVDRLEKRYGSEEWLYNRAATFSCRVKERFDWGGVEMSFDVKDGEIRDISLFTDSLETAVFDRMRALLCHSRYMPDEISARLGEAAQSDSERRIATDMAAMIKKKLFD